VFYCALRANAAGITRPATPRQSLSSAPWVRPFGTQRERLRPGAFSLSSSIRRVFFDQRVDCERFVFEEGGRFGFVQNKFGNTTEGSNHFSHITPPELNFGRATSCS